MRRAEVDGIDFDQIIEVGLTKKVAALAFVRDWVASIGYKADETQYNCLSQLPGSTF